MEKSTRTTSKNQFQKSYRPTPEEGILPEGLSHQGRYEYWRSKAIETWRDSGKYKKTCI